jgi:hypothetical protein
VADGFLRPADRAALRCDDGVVSLIERLLPAPVVEA